MQTYLYWHKVCLKSRKGSVVNGILILKDVIQKWLTITFANILSLKYSRILEKEMATHSSVLAWRIPGTEEPGGLLSRGSHRVGHNWSDLAAAAV